MHWIIQALVYQTSCILSNISAKNWQSAESFLAGVAFSNRANKLSLNHRLDKVDANIYNGIFSNVFPIIAAFIKLYVIYTVDLRDCGTLMIPKTLFSHEPCISILLSFSLTLKSPITTAADDTFHDIFPIF